MEYKIAPIRGEIGTMVVKFTPDLRSISTINTTDYFAISLQYDIFSFEMGKVVIIPDKDMSVPGFKSQVGPQYLLFHHNMSENCLVIVAFILVDEISKKSFCKLTSISSPRIWPFHRHIC